LDSGSEHPPLIRGGRSARAVIPDHELLRCIGKGAYGEVWLARDAIGTFHAVKIVYRSAFSDSVPLEREFNGIRKFTPISRSHPGFVHILHVGRNEADGYLFYVMELGDDETTGQIIDPKSYAPLTLGRLLEKRGRLPLGESLALCIQLADALDYLHRQQLIHRDIKPSNIIFVKNVPKFADIGLVTDVATKGRDVTYLGTPGRIAPEGPGSPASDVYSLGKIIYETGLGQDLARFPELPTELIRGGDEAGLFQLNRIILKACELDVRQRHQSAAVLRDELMALQNSTRGNPPPV
jgi:serine/threonine protein kinase